MVGTAVKAPQVWLPILLPLRLTLYTWLGNLSPQEELKIGVVPIYTMEYYSAMKRNEIGSFVETWMDLETVIQSEVSQKEENKYRILTHTCGT